METFLERARNCNSSGGVDGSAGFIAVLEADPIELDFRFTISNRTILRSGGEWFV
jgi:hypothetical protein